MGKITEFMSYASQPQGQNKYGRREFLRTSSAAIAGTGLVLATGGLTGLIAQEPQSKTKELTELLETNESVFPRSFSGGFIEYPLKGDSLPQGVAQLPKLPKGQSYGTRLPLNVSFDLPNSKKAVLVYNPAVSTEALGLYDKNARFVRDTGMVVQINRSHASLELDVYEHDSATVRGVQIPINVGTVFQKNNLDDTPGGYRTEYFIIIREKGRSDSSASGQFLDIPEMDRATATSKYNEFISLVLQEARNKVRFATSSTVPPRFNGIASLQPCTIFSSRLAVISVSIKPGAIALQRIFLDPNSRAIDLVKPIIPALLAA